ncbi:AraC family transcriptional regulator [Pedobacter sp. GR22-6]|uniref:AraC family transcriptional regulator n=1 Tax=Pedobacter sp. GR22-6 TaxID=3127957 RepID=UPI00307E5236
MIQFVPTDSKPRSIALESLYFTHQNQSTSVSTTAQFIYIVSGAGTLFIGNIITPYQKGDLIFIGSNVHYVFIPPNESDHPSEAIAVSFIPDYIKMLLDIPELFELKAFFKKYSFGFILKKNQSTHFPLLFDQLNGTSGPDLLFKFFQLVSVLSNSEALEQFQPFASAQNNENRRLEKVLAFVRQNIGKNINLVTVASVANMTPNAFCRFFKQQCGCQFITYLNTTRITMACKEIISNGHVLSISETAYRVGFNSVTNFNRVFKIVTGLSPTEYLNEHRLK